MTKVWNIIEAIARFFIYKLFRIRLSDENFDKLMQFGKFGLVGVSNSLIYYGLYLLFLKLDMHYTPANLLSFSISVVNSFYWNNKYVFKKDVNAERHLLKTFIKTFLSYAGTGIFLSNILLAIWVEILHIPAEIGPIINLIFTIPINYVVNKYWAYKDKSYEEEGNDNGQNNA